MKLRTKLILMMLSLSLFVAIVVGLFRVVWTTEEATQLIKQNLTSISGLISAHSRTALSFNDTTLAENNLEALNDIPSVRYSCIYLSDGKVFSSYSRQVADQSQCPDFQALEKVEVVINDDSLLVLTKVTQGERLIGWVFINSDLSPIQAARAEQVMFSVLAFILSVVLAFIIASWIQRFVTTPINSIADIANIISKEKKHDLRLPVNSNNEIGQLAGSINYMLDSLQSSQDDQREILSSMLDGVITINEKGIILTFNHSAERIFGFLQEDILGKNISCLMPDPYATSHANYIKNYCNGGESHLIGGNRTVQAKRSDGEIFPLNLSIAELPRKAGEPRRFIGSCIDLTKEKNQEEQLRRTQKMDAIGQLTGGVAHDYNNMLGIILGYSDLLMNNIENDSKLHKYTEQIQHAAERGAKLTNKLLTFSKKDGGEVESIKLNDILLESKSMLSKVLTARIDLDYSLKSTWQINGDVSELEDAIVNLCINAMHAIDDKGQVIISTENKSLNKFDVESLGFQSGDYVALSIKDSGKGMSQEVRDKIFEPFFTTKGDRGTGLGLSQVYAFVEGCGGGVVVDSMPGRGAEFTLYFPRQNFIPEPVSKSLKSNKSIFGNESLLVVDDEKSLLDLVSESLRIYGYRIYTASNVSEAVSVLEENPIDMVISDIVMPDGDGYELAETIKNRFPKVKVQLVTGFDQGEYQSAEKSELKRHTISKPYRTQTLLNAIDTQLH